MPGVASNWTTETFRAEVAEAAQSVLDGQVEAGAKMLWSLGLSNGELDFGGGLWNVWGGITDEFTHPRGDASLGRELAVEAAHELREVVGDSERERSFCDRWIDRLSDSA